jgi:hypothetical protein
MSRVTQDEKEPVQQPNKRPYHSPRLRVYGPLRDLTTGGGGSAQEPGGMGMGSPFEHP